MYHLLHRVDLDGQGRVSDGDVVFPGPLRDDLLPLGSVSPPDLVMLSLLLSRCSEILLQDRDDPIHTDREVAELRRDRAPPLGILERLQ